jgi:hypothetical protein
MAFEDHYGDRPRRRQRPHSSLSKNPLLGVDAFKGVPIQCQFCSGQSFRRSTLRGEDFTQLLLMRYPVRCLRCSQRQSVSFTVAGISLSSKIKPKRPDRNNPAAGSWTEPAEQAASQDSEAD